ncbi:MAG: hypothetical protein U1E10_11255 [Bdellovibrionales bacterium]|nr:hypothetical protein [Bdellovibrionales bacterium]
MSVFKSVSASFFAVSFSFFSASVVMASVTPEKVASETTAPAAATSVGSQQNALGLKKFEESNTLTDPKLRADAGSLSQLSMRASLSYFGPTLGDLSAPEQPNPDGSVGNYSQAMKGSVSLRYRLSPDRTISAGTGISLIKPFHGWDRTDVNNPFVSYDFSNRFGKLQMRNSPGLTVSTVPNYTDIGQFGGVSWDNSLVYGIADTKLAISFDTAINYWIFTRAHRPGSTKSGGDGRASQYSISWYPGLKYNFTDKLNLNGSAGFSLYNPREVFNDTTLWNRTVTLRLGLGYAVTRDIYFAPYLQGFVTRPSLDLTTLNVSGVFSVL